MRFIFQLAFVVAAIGSGCQAYSLTGTKITVEKIFGDFRNQQLQQRSIPGSTQQGGGLEPIKQGWKHGTTHQRFMLFNVHLNAPLGAHDLFDPERRNVTVEKAPYDSQNFSRMIEWRLVQVAEGRYAIVHHHYNEPLYAFWTDENFEYGRPVLTWLAGLDKSDQQCWWEIIPRPDGHYLIRNVRFDEFLLGSASEDLAKEKVYTRRNRGTDFDDEYLWDIININ